MAGKSYTEQELRALHERREQTYAQNLSTQKRHSVLFEPFNISHSEYRVLAMLYFSKDCEPSVMADKLLILRQTMTKVIDSLEAKGLVARTVHPSDRRKLYINLLPKGRQVARDLLCIESDYHARVDDQVSPEELDTYLRLSRKIREIRSRVMQEIVEERGAQGVG